MKLSTREDIEAPLDRVHAAVTDFDAFERALMRRGIDVVREGEGAAPVGTVWHAKPEWNGRVWDVAATLMSRKDPEGFTMECHSGGLVALVVVDLVALGANRTRLFASVDVRPTTIGARMMLQPMKLAKGGLSRRFKDRVAGFAAGIA